MYIQGTLLQHGDSLKNAYKDKISQSKFQKKTCLNIVHRDKVQNCNLSSMPMLLKIDCNQNINVSNASRVSI